MPVDEAVRVGSLGLQIILDTDISLTSLTSSLIRCRKPSGKMVDFTGAVDNEAGGTITYTTTSVDDIDEAGMWALHAKLTYNNGNVFYGKTVNLEVKAPSY